MGFHPLPYWFHGIPDIGIILLLMMLTTAAADIQ
jgi:hypothetical protein